MHTCDSCGAAMSAWETTRCLSCKLPKRRAYSNADAAVFVLEKERYPVTTYDIVRGIQREFGRKVSKASLTVALAADRRCCWAGRSTYGLFRHGVFPGPRTLSGVAKLFLYSWAKPIRLEHVAFAMRYTGYRFQQASLCTALRYDPHVCVAGWRWLATQPGEDVRLQLLLLGVSPTIGEIDCVAVRCSVLVDDSIKEYRRRVGSK